MPGAADRPAIDEMLMIEPAPEARRCGMACLQPSMTDSRLTAWTLRQFSRVSCSANTISPPMPALLTSTDRPPMAATASATTRTQSASSVTSWRKAKAWPGWSALIDAASASAPARSRSVTATFAPSRASMRAMAWPSPPAAPVISAVLPATRPLMPSLPSSRPRHR